MRDPMPYPAFAPVIELPADTPVLDFSKGPIDEPQVARHRFAIGRYNEKRPLVYTTPLFAGTNGQVRDIHMGIDLFAPVGTPVRTFADCEIHLAGYNAAAGDYGHTVVAAYLLDGLRIYALYGHLDQRSTQAKSSGQKLRRGEVLGWIGDRHENGGWLPHLHFQLSYEKPATPDMPGVVSAQDHAFALLKYPDPRLVLGPIY